ncbi:MAG TPA: efflux RND transporter periplasmic adaptor subunit, partial [Flavobacteriales bacterium]|nr:efflux RND transporter periplasmic adaptor subunit [Flavobacteriales bacterium]
RSALDTLRPAPAATAGPEAGEQPAVVLFTSGSEGVPKGVELTHHNLLANIRQMLSVIDLTDDDRVFNALPIFHSFGLTVGTMLGLVRGVYVFLYPSPLHYRIVPSALYDRYCTVFLATNTFLNNQEQLVYMREKRKLLAANVRSDSVFRQSQLGSITSNLDLIQQNLRFLRENLQNLVIKAPIDGQLSGLNVELGQTKQKGERIAQIDVLGSFKVRARIPEHYVSRVSMGLLGTFTHAGKEHSIEVFKVYPEVSNGEFDVDLRFTGAQPVDIRRGQTFQVRLQLSEDLQAVMLPRGPFFQDTGGQWVYVVDAEGKAVKREVKLGRQNPDMYEVLEGLRPGDHVVTSRYAAFNDADELVIQ